MKYVKTILENTRKKWNVIHNIAIYTEKWTAIKIFHTDIMLSIIIQYTICMTEWYGSNTLTFISMIYKSQHIKIRNDKLTTRGSSQSVSVTCVFIWSLSSIMSRFFSKKI